MGEGWKRAVAAAEATRVCNSPYHTDRHGPDFCTKTKGHSGEHGQSRRSENQHSGYRDE